MDEESWKLLFWNGWCPDGFRENGFVSSVLGLWCTKLSVDCSDIWFSVFGVPDPTTAISAATAFTSTTVGTGTANTSSSLASAADCDPTSRTTPRSTFNISAASTCSFTAPYRPSGNTDEYASAVTAAQDTSTSTTACASTIGQQQVASEEDILPSTVSVLCFCSLQIVFAAFWMIKKYSAFLCLTAVVK